jgi:hypothetical protein
MHQGDAQHTGHHRFRDHHTDTDDDGVVDRYDCNPDDPSNHGSAEVCNWIDDDCNGLVDDLDDAPAEVCNGIDDDCDGLVDDLDDSSAEVCNGIDDDCNGLVDDLDDVDGDGHPSCPALPHEDCDDFNAVVWARPSAIQSFQIMDPSGTMEWNPPVDPGSLAVTYHVIRAGTTQGFPTGACITSDGAAAQDPEDPGPGEVFYYLARAQNACPTPIGLGSLGFDSAGTPRSGPPWRCPALCLDGTRQSAEQCDGPDLNGETCTTLGFNSGSLRCTSSCVFDVSACSICGNGIRDGAEVCDGADLGGQTCQSQGRLPGTLTCWSTCNGFSYDGCVGFLMPAEPVPQR